MCKFRNHIKNCLYLLVFILCISTKANAQDPVRGVYVDSANGLINNPPYIINFALANNFNYLVLYINSSVNTTNLATFVSAAHANGISVGASGESVNFFNWLIAYNNAHPINERIDVANLEFEFWIDCHTHTSNSTTCGAGQYIGEYCTKYLSPNGYSCDNAGAWQYTVDTILPKTRAAINVYNAASPSHKMLFEAYYGWPDSTQFTVLVPYLDRLMLHAYRTSDIDVYGYSKERIHWISSAPTGIGCNKTFTILPIFSSESAFMNNAWLRNKPFTRPYDTYTNGGNTTVTDNFMSDPSGGFHNNKDNIRIGGYQWFMYSLMPAQILLNGTVITDATVTICNGTSIKANHGPAVNGSEYLWNTGATTESITPTLSGTYTVTVKNARNRVYTASTTIIIASGTPPSVSISTTTPLACFSNLNGSLQAIATGGTGSYTYLWNNSSASTTSTISGLKQQHYSVTVTDANGCVAMASTFLRQPYKLTSCINSVNITCPTNGTVSTENVTGGTMPYSYLWNNSAITSSISVTTAGTYTITITDANGCSFSRTASVTGVLNPIANIAATGPTTFCTVGNVVLNVTSAQAGYSYQWKKNGVNISGANLSSYSATSSGSYTCVVTNTCGSITSNAIVVSVEITPVATIAAAGPTTFCTGGSVILNVTSATTGYIYQWKKNGANLGGANTSSYSATATGSYQCVVTNTCGSVTSNAINITVEITPVATIANIGATTFCSGGSVSLYVTTAITGYSYQWKNGTSNTGTNSSNYLANTSGSYTCIVTNSCGSVTSNAIVVTVNPLPAACVIQPNTTAYLGVPVPLGCACVSGSTYNWTPTTGIISSPTLCNPSAAPATTTTYTIVETNTYGCTNSNTTKVTVVEELLGLTFDGVDDRCQVPDVSAYNILGGAFTIEAHLSFDQTSAIFYPMILSKRGGGSGGVLFSIYNVAGSSKGKLFLQMGGVTPNYIDVSGPVVNDGLCHDIAVTRDASGVILFYVDGVASTSPGTASTSISSTNPFTIGLDPGNTSQTPFKGNIGYVRLWNVARTSTQINDYKNYYLIPASQTGLKAQWQLDNTDQTTSPGQAFRDFATTLNGGFRGTNSTTETSDPSWATICTYRLGDNTLTSNENSSYLLNDSLLKYLPMQETMFSVNPNPTVGKLNLSYQFNNNQTCVFKIYNSMGSVIKEENLSNEKVSSNIDLSEFANGMYAYSFFVDGIRIKYGKVILKK